MIITFCGHADFQKTETYERELLAILDAIIGDGSAELYLGGYGLFDAFAFECGKKIQKKPPEGGSCFCDSLSEGIRTASLFGKPAKRI